MGNGRGVTDCLAGLSFVTLNDLLAIDFSSILRQRVFVWKARSFPSSYVQLLIVMYI